MRKKLVIGAVLVALSILATVVAVRFMLPGDPPLRVGMTEAAVNTLLGPPESSLGDTNSRSDYYVKGPDLFGNRRAYIVTFDADGRVKSLYAENLPKLPSH